MPLAIFYAPDHAHAVQTRHLHVKEHQIRLQILGQYTLDSAIVTALTDELGGLLRTPRTSGAG